MYVTVHMQGLAICAYSFIRNCYYNTVWRETLIVGKFGGFTTKIHCQKKISQIPLFFRVKIFNILYLAIA